MARTAGTNRRVEFDLSVKTTGNVRIGTSSYRSGLSIKNNGSKKRAFFFFFGLRYFPKNHFFEISLFSRKILIS